MNCPKCNAPIDYRFCTDCPQCESELTPKGPAEDCVSTSQSVEIKELKLSPGDHVANAVLVLMCSGLGSVLGAVMSYICCGAVYLMLFTSTGSSADC